MFLEMQDFDFAKIESNCPNFASTVPKFNQFCQKKILLGDVTASPASPAPITVLEICYLNYIY